MRLRLRLTILYLTACTTVLAKPPQPQPHSVTLTWQDTVNQAGTTYNVFKASGTCTATTIYNWINMTPITTKSYVDTNVLAGAVYCYAASAVNILGESVKTPGVPAAIPNNHKSVRVSIGTGKKK